MTVCCGPTGALSATPSAPAICRRSPATKAWPASKSPSAASNHPPGPRPPPPAKGRAASPADFPTPSSLQGSMNQHMRPEPVPFIDLAAQRRRLRQSIDEAVARVLDHCQVINGPEATALEAALRKFRGGKDGVGY